MQREEKWKNWPILLCGVVLVGLCLFFSHKLQYNKTLNAYLADIAGAVTAIIISIATYDEWERRQQRKRYLPPELMGVDRVKQEVYQLLYQYAFVLALRFDKSSKAMRTVRAATVSKAEFDKPEVELKAKSAEHLSQSDPELKNNLFKLSQQALKKFDAKKQSYADINQLILQTERTVGQIDLALGTYGYSFTPEVHKWALEVREGVSQAITGKIAVLSIRLAAASSQKDKKLNDQAAGGVTEMVEELLAVGRKAGNVHPED